ncbi:MAG: hypothetical protein HYX65_06960 [Gemmatimonadetes bacterium]|nr:hypothetical protein [Gemmatimonadota bacterium]
MPQSLRLTSLFALVAAALAGGACGATEPKVNLGLVTADTGRLFAMSGTDPIFPTAINIPSRVVVLATVFSDGSVPFDLAFDLTPAGAVRVLPARSVVLGPNVVPPVVGLFVPTGTFDATTEAPVAGFTYDSVQVVSPGQPFVVQVRPVDCSYGVLTTMHAKMVVDSVNLVSRLIHYRIVLNPNCGRRGLVPGGF